MYLFLKAPDITTKVNWTNALLNTFKDEAETITYFRTMFP